MSVDGDIESILNPDAADLPHFSEGSLGLPPFAPEHVLSDPPSEDRSVLIQKICGERHNTQGSGADISRPKGLSDRLFNRVVFKIYAAVARLAEEFAASEDEPASEVEVDLGEELVDGKLSAISPYPVVVPVTYIKGGPKLGYCLDNIARYGIDVRVIWNNKIPKNAPKWPDEGGDGDTSPEHKLKANGDFSSYVDGKTSIVWLDEEGCACKNKEEATYFLWRTGGQYKNKHQKQESQHKAWKYEVRRKDQPDDQPDFWVCFSVKHTT